MTKEMIQVTAIRWLNKNSQKSNVAILIESENDFEYTKAYNGYFQFLLGDCYNSSYFPETDEKRERIYPKTFGELTDLYVAYCEKVSVELTGCNFDEIFDWQSSDYKYREFIENNSKMGLYYIDCREMRSLVEDAKETTIQVVFVFE